MDYEIPGAPSGDEVDAFLAGLRGRKLAPLTADEVELVLRRLREGAVVRTSGAEDYTFFSVREGRFVIDDFNMGRRRTRETTEAGMRDAIAHVVEFRMLLSPLP